MLKELLNSTTPTFSFEFFPPKNEKSSEDLYQTISKLKSLNPSFISVTYGAGGTTRDLTKDLVFRLNSESNLNVVSHLTCVSSTQDEIFEILTEYEKNNVKAIMALRGDAPKGTTFKKTENGFGYAHELVNFIKKKFPKMTIGVAGYPEGHPETPNRLKEMDYLKQKVDEGADFICTQLFFDNNEFYDFRERCEISRINIPIIAGIMPITSLNGMNRMAELSAGTKFPAALLKSLKRAQNDEFVQKVGEHWATEQVRDLLDKKVDGVHFYTLNKSKSTLKIYDSLGVTSSEGFY